MALACWLCGSVGGRVQKRDNGSLLTFLSGRKLPPALSLMPDTSVPLCLPLVPFKLLLWCWSSQGVSLSNTVCGFFKRNSLGLQKFLVPTAFLLVFAARSYGDLPSWHWNPGLGGPVVGLGITPEISLLNFYSPHVDMGPVHSASPPLIPVWMDVFCFCFCFF